MAVSAMKTEGHSGAGRNPATVSSDRKLELSLSTFFAHGLEEGQQKIRLTHHD